MEFYHDKIDLAFRNSYALLEWRKSNRHYH